MSGVDVVMQMTEPLGDLRIPMTYRQVDGFWTVSTPILPNLSCGDPDRDEARRLALQAVRLAFQWNAQAV